MNNVAKGFEEFMETHTNPFGEVAERCCEDDECDDMVNHPPHYTRDGAMECIDEMIAVFGKHAVANFCLCNVWKYRTRALYKGGDEDMEKSDWYMKKYIELTGGNGRDPF